MKVTRLPVDTGPAAWNSLLPSAEPAVHLSSDIKADIAIIGAGFAGLSAARRLTQIAPEKRVVVLDATRVGEGPVGRNSGFMIDLPHELSSADYATTLEKDRVQIGLNRQAIEFARSAAHEYQMPDEAFDPIGKVNGAADVTANQHNLDYAKHLEVLGEKHELLDRSAMKKLTGSDFYQSGLYTPGAVLLQPALYARNLMIGMQNKVSVFENSPVIALERENANWNVRTKSGSVQARTVILATNGHVESFGYFKRQVFHVMLYGSMTEALNPAQDALTGDKKWGITPSSPAGTTMRKHFTNDGPRIITRNQMSYSPSMRITSSKLAKIAKRHKQSFAKRYPELEDVRQEFTWAGRLCMSRNSAPAFGEIDQGLISACCQNGLGTTKGTMAGIAAAELAVEGETEIVKSLYQQGKPTRLPPAPLDSMGANTFMRWGEFRARREL